MKKYILKKIAPAAASYLVRFIGWTLRFQEYPGSFSKMHRDKSEPFIIVFWHSRILLPSWYFRSYPMCAMISSHSDGEFADNTVGRMGINSVRGSTTSGGSAAFRQLIQMIKNGSNAAITPDGPRGPARQLQEGVIMLGQISQRPIIPLSFSASRAIRLKSWDRFLIPLPFSRASMVFAEPILVPRQLDSAAREDLRIRVEETLNRVTDLADELVGQPKL